MGGQRQRDLRVADQDVGVVLDLLGPRSDAVHEVDGTEKVAEGVRPLDRIAAQRPLGPFDETRFDFRFREFLDHHEDPIVADGPRRTGDLVAS